MEIKAKRISSNADTILNLASTGKTEAEIAKILNISIHTVKYHKKKYSPNSKLRIQQKLFNG
ncbi:MAG: LuxR C-terminal-related transcriptional regulator [Prevotella sp.]|nr:LuxR C-terminal-related transcriptional regulator [Prevotella sp.]